MATWSGRKVRSSTTATTTASQRTAEAFAEVAECAGWHGNALP